MDKQNLLPDPPRTQALSSKTFSPPPLDGSLTLPEIFDWHAKHSSHHRLFVFSRENGAIRTIPWVEAVSAVHTGAKLVRSVMGWAPGMKGVPVVAILASSDTITYFTMIMSIMRAGYTVFPISTRNSPEAVAHLLSKVAVKHVFLGHEQALVNLGKEALEILTSQQPTLSKPKFSPLPTFDDLFRKSWKYDEDLPYEPRGPDEIVIYMHSSGSTAFPKAIPWTNTSLAQLALIPYFGEHDLTDVNVSLHTIPMYHGMGIVQLCWTASCGVVISAFEPRTPAHIPTPESHFKAAVACNSDIIYCVPAIIEAWSRNPDYVKWLATRRGVLFGGGPLSKPVGDYLTSQGVAIFSLYGLTEGGIVSPVLPAAPGYDWEYFRFSVNVTPEMVPREDGIYELILVSNPYSRPSLTNTKVNGVDAYATSDLFMAHPQKPGYWRVYGRNDDQIMHSTGEKTNPGPLENILNQDPRVQSSVMFGRGKFQAGVIIDPKAEYKFDPSDDKNLADFRNKIWPTVQRMNTFAPQHSRIFKEMIIISKPSKPFQYTAKSTARRQAVLRDYEYEITAVYDAVADSTQSNIPPPAEWNALAILDFVRSVVDDVLRHKVKDDDDIFQHGCDSLQATWIKNTLFRALRDSAQFDTRPLADNIVYANPTVLALTSFLKSAVSGETPSSTNDIDFRVNAMRNMVGKYTAKSFPVHEGSPSNGSTMSQGEVVLVTGTTGALGCYLLAELVDNPAITRIYALNRPRLSGSSKLKQRQERALLDRGLRADIIESTKVKFIEGDLAFPRFGLAEDTFEEMRSSVTHIIHNAWPVDFNLSLASFEPSIKGIRNLIDFALTSSLPSPPNVIFTSSIGVFQNTNSIRAPLLPEAPVAPEVAVGTGYTESKWASEEILLQASKRSKLSSTIVRVGQLAGGLNGAWNTAEWFPALVQSGQVCGCLPADDRTMDWISLPIAAKALIDFRYAGHPASSRIINLISPRPVSWSSLAGVIAADLSVPLVPFSDWFKRLEERRRSKNDVTEVEEMKRIPALRLLPFFRSMSAKVADSDNAFGFRGLACDNAIQLSSTLSRDDLAELGAKDARNWMKYWRGVGFIKG